MAEKNEEVKKDLEKALDESLADLQKAASGDEPVSKKPVPEKSEPAPEIEKAQDDDEDGDKGKKKGKKPCPPESEDEKGDEKEDDDDEEEGAMRGGYRKSAEDNLAKSETASNAIEVSKFLKEIVKSLGEMVGDLTHRVRKLEKSNRALAEALVKSQTAQVEVVKSLGSEIASFGRAPLPRKGVSGAPAIEKSFRNDGKGSEGDKSDLSKSQVADKLADLEIGGKIPVGTTSKFEMTGELHKSYEGLVYGESK